MSSLLRKTRKLGESVGRFFGLTTSKEKFNAKYRIRFNTYKDDYGDLYKALTRFVAFIKVARDNFSDDGDDKKLIDYLRGEFIYDLLYRDVNKSNLKKYRQYSKFRHTRRINRIVASNKYELYLNQLHFTNAFINTNFFEEFNKLKEIIEKIKEANNGRHPAQIRRWVRGYMTADILINHYNGDKDVDAEENKRIEEFYGKIKHFTNSTTLTDSSRVVTTEAQSEEEILNDVRAAVRAVLCHSLYNNRLSFKLVQEYLRNRLKDDIRNKKITLQNKETEYSDKFLSKILQNLENLPHDDAQLSQIVKYILEDDKLKATNILAFTNKVSENLKILEDIDKVSEQSKVSEQLEESKETASVITKTPDSHLIKTVENINTKRSPTSAAVNMPTFLTICKAIFASHKPKLFTLLDEFSRSNPKETAMKKSDLKRELQTLALELFNFIERNFSANIIYYEPSFLALYAAFEKKVLDLKTDSDFSKKFKDLLTNYEEECKKIFEIEDRILSHNLHLATKRGGSRRSKKKKTIS